MKPIRIPALAPEQLAELEELYRTTRDARLRTRAKMVLLAAEQHLTAAQIAEIVRASEKTARRWLRRYLAEGVEGLRDAPHPGAPRKVTEGYRELLVQVVRRRPRSQGVPFSVWTLRRLADYMAEQTGIRVEYETVRVHLKDAGIVLSRPQHTITSPDPEYALKKGDRKTRDNLPEGEVFYYADEFNLSWMPTLKAMWGPKGRQVMISTPSQPKSATASARSTTTPARRCSSSVDASAGARRPNCWKRSWRSIRRTPSAWLGTVPTPTRTRRSRRSCAERLAA